MSEVKWYADRQCPECQGTGTTCEYHGPGLNEPIGCECLTAYPDEAFYEDGSPADLVEPPS